MWLTHSNSDSLDRSQQAAKNTEVLAGLKNGLLLAASVAVLLLPPLGTTGLLPERAKVQGSQVAGAGQRPQQADFGTATPSPDAREIADWVARSGDNLQASFAIIDKRGARLYVFTPDARLVGSSLVLLGSAPGDDTAPDLGNRPLSQVRSHERTTAAGRFVSEPGHDETGESVVWVDYDSALAMHRVKVVDPKERRMERIATDSVDDKRISNGCINVPVAFYDSVVQAALGRGRAIVYVLPEVKPLHDVFLVAKAAPTR